MGRPPPQGLSRQVQGAAAQAEPPPGVQATLSASPRHSWSSYRSHLVTSVSARFRAGKAHGQDLSVGLLVGLTHWALEVGLWRATPIAVDLGPSQPRSSQRFQGTRALRVLWRHRSFFRTEVPVSWEPLSPSSPSELD